MAFCCSDKTPSTYVYNSTKYIMVQLHAYLPSLISTECFESQGSAIHYMKHLAQKGCSIGVCGENERAYLGHMIHISSYLKLQLFPIIFEREAEVLRSMLNIVDLSSCHTPMETWLMHINLTYTFPTML